MELDLVCQDCGAALHLADGQKTISCFFCRSPAVVERPPNPGQPRPAFALGFVVTPEGARDIVLRWQASLGLFRDTKIRKAPVENIAGVYLPAYLYSAAAYSDYSCRAAIDWTTGAGDSVKNHTQWYPVQGRHAAYVRDLLVPASRGIGPQELEGVQPYDLRALHRYSPALISGWAAEDPTLAIDGCWAQARRDGEARARGQLAWFLPGDRQDGLRCSTRLTHESLDTILLPLWILAIRPDPGRPPIRVLVNGQTGRLQGRAAVDWLRVAGIAGLVLVPLLGLLAGLFLLVALVGR